MCVSQKASVFDQMTCGKNTLWYFCTSNYIKVKSTFPITVWLNFWINGLILKKNIDKDVYSLLDNECFEQFFFAYIRKFKS